MRSVATSALHASVSSEQDRIYIRFRRPFDGLGSDIPFEYLSIGADREEEVTVSAVADARRWIHMSLR